MEKTVIERKVETKQHILHPGEMMCKEEYIQKRNRYEASRICNLSHRTRLAMHPVLWLALTTMNALNGFHCTLLSNCKLPRTDKPIIFCITHIGKHDIEICAQVLKKHFYLLSGDFENLHGTFDGTFIELNGIVYLNKYIREDKAKSKQTCVRVLKSGGNIMWFPEGVWNLSPNQPVLHLPFGIIEVAQKANAAIIPVAIEQYGKEFFVNIGEVFDVAPYCRKYPSDVQQKLAAIADLRDIMATLKWDIWASKKPWNRKDMPENVFDQFVNERLKEWHGFTYEDVRAREFNPNGGVNEREAFAHLTHLNPSRENAFLLRER